LESGDPEWKKISKINSLDEIIGFLNTEEGIILFSKAGGFAVIDGSGNITKKGVLKLPRGSYRCRIRKRERMVH